jgi:hypothetical protein
MPHMTSPVEGRARDMCAVVASHRRAIYGMKLRRNAINWKTAISPAMPKMLRAVAYGFSSQH